MSSIDHQQGREQHVDIGPGDATARLAHDLKNPLTAVKALVALVAEDACTPRMKERLEVVIAEVRRMEVILRDHLSPPQPTPPQPPGTPADAPALDLGRLADEVVELLEARASAAGVKLLRNPETATVAGDAGQLRSALLNLVGNAIEATPAGGQVDVSVREREGRAEIDIRDTGNGIAPQDLPRVGTPFFTLRRDGTGLGVMLARSAVARHGGSLVYESQLGHGTLARVSLPGRPAAEPRAVRCRWRCGGAP